jgi:hypothetical protein
MTKWGIQYDSKSEPSVTLTNGLVELNARRIEREFDLLISGRPQSAWLCVQSSRL